MAKTCGWLVKGMTSRPCLRPPQHKGQHADHSYRAAKRKRNKRYYAGHTGEFHDRRIANYDPEREREAKRRWRARVKRQGVRAMLRKLADEDGSPRCRSYGG